MAAALLGRLEPSGRLVTTWPVADGATPAWSVTPVDGVLAYEEGTFVGYRGHAAGRAPEPHFWFGHGLGYGTWDYLDGPWTPPARHPRSPSRCGTRPTAPPARSSRCTSPPPSRSSRCGSSAGLRRTSRPATRPRSWWPRDPRMWRRWDVDAGGWAALEGGELLVARGLGDVRLRLPVTR